MLSQSNLKIKEQKMIHKILSIINVNKVDDKIFNDAMGEIVDICGKVLKGTYKKSEKETSKKETKGKKEEKKEEKKSFKGFGK